VSEFKIYKVNNSVFCIGDFDFKDKFIIYFFDILSLGSKFVPCFFSKPEEFFAFYLNQLDKEMESFNSKLFYEN
jgi:hypothetical protein